MKGFIPPVISDLKDHLLNLPISDLKEQLSNLPVPDFKDRLSNLLVVWDLKDQLPKLPVISVLQDKLANIPVVSGLKERMLNLPVVSVLREQLLNLPVVSALKEQLLNFPVVSVLKEQLLNLSVVSVLKGQLLKIPAAMSVIKEQLPNLPVVSVLLKRPVVSVLREQLLKRRYWLLLILAGVILSRTGRSLPPPSPQWAPSPDLRTPSYYSRRNISPRRIPKGQPSDPSQYSVASQTETPSQSLNRSPHYRPSAPHHTHARPLHHDAPVADPVKHSPRRGRITTLAPEVDEALSYSPHYQPSTPYTACTPLLSHDALAAKPVKYVQQPHRRVVTPEVDEEPSNPHEDLQLARRKAQLGRDFKGECSRLSDEVFHCNDGRLVREPSLPAQPPKKNMVRLDRKDYESAPDLTHADRAPRDAPLARPVEYTNQLPRRDNTLAVEVPLVAEMPLVVDPHEEPEPLRYKARCEGDQMIEYVKQSREAFARNEKGLAKEQLPRHDNTSVVEVPLVIDPHEDPESLRLKARREGDRMAEYFKRSREAFASGKKRLAKELSSEGEARKEDMLRLDRAASEKIFQENNKELGPNTVDLHKLYVAEAVHYFTKAAEKAQSCRESLCVIVGKGNHSDDNIPKIKHAIQELGERLGMTIDVDRTNEGRLIVNFN